MRVEVRVPSPAADAAELRVPTLNPIRASSRRAMRRRTVSLFLMARSDPQLRRIPKLVSTRSWCLHHLCNPILREVD